MGLSIICLVITIIMGVTSGISQAGPFFIGFFAFLSYAVRGSANYKGHSLTKLIQAIVTLAIY
jgi:hypothetical protein